jgi:Arc/MetJ family transcription regulator
MRTTLALDDDLLAEAQRLTGTKEKSSLVREALGAVAGQLGVAYSE